MHDLSHLDLVCSAVRFEGTSMAPAVIPLAHGRS